MAHTSQNQLKCHITFVYFFAASSPVPVPQPPPTPSLTQILCTQNKLPTVSSHDKIVYSTNYHATQTDIFAHSLDEQLCHSDHNNTAWLVIQQRGPAYQTENIENFNRSWADYKHGFGQLNGEFWYGNDLLHKLTQDDDIELLIVLEDWNGEKLQLNYDLFRIDSEEFNYNLIVGEPKFNDHKLDAMYSHSNQDFSTFDRQNDKTNYGGVNGCCSCAVSYGSGWWFNG